MDDKLTLLAVFAHPDDEAFGVGGTLCRYAAEGIDVHLVTATRGEAGQISRPELANNANLPAVRERELRCACATYGIHPPILLDYVDGQLTIVHQGQAVGKLVRLLRSLRPQVVIAFGPDGIYGHYDHIAAHRWTTIAVEMATDPDCFPDGISNGDGGSCEPFQVSKLYYTALPEERLTEMARGGRPAVMMDGVPFPFVGRPQHEITTVIDARAYAAQKLQGISCHRTQLAPDSPMLNDPEGTLAQPWFAVESYVLARSSVGLVSGVEDDLFARLRT